MATAWRDVARQALPEPVLTRVQAGRWALRQFRHRLRWLASGRRGAGIGIGRFDGMARRLPAAFGRHRRDPSQLRQRHFFAAIPDVPIDGDAVILDVGAHIGTFACWRRRKSRAAALCDRSQRGDLSPARCQRGIEWPIQYRALPPRVGRAATARLRCITIRTATTVIQLPGRWPAHTKS